MLERLFGGDRYIALTRSLDAAALRHEAISNNLANVNTPGYKRQEVAFESQLAQALGKAKSLQGAGGSPVAAVRPQAVTLNATSERADGNNVDIELEMVNMAVNTQRFAALSQSVGGYFNGLKMVINGR